jgi:hypothetical protein
MTDKMDFKGALEDMKLPTQNYAVSIMMDHFETIQFALRLAERVQSGKISEEALSIAYDTAAEYDGFISGHILCETYRKMTEQLLKEVRDD